MKRFERFNEMVFESYCMKSVLNAIKKERNRKDARGEVEQSLSTLTDAMLYALSTEDDEMIQAEKPYQIFGVYGGNIPIYDPKLSCDRLGGRYSRRYGFRQSEGLRGQSRRDMAQQLPTRDFRL